MKTYGTILCDPPWPSTPGGDRAIKNKYSLMKMPDLLAMNIPAHKDCAMFMWVPGFHLHDAMALLPAWGFKFKSVAFVWVKMKKDMSSPSMGMGFWTRQCTEFVLLSTRGHPGLRKSGDWKKGMGTISQMIMEPRREHSRKPDIYPLIQKLTKGPYLEMFARQTVPGWDHMGYEIGKYKALD